MYIARQYLDNMNVAFDEIPASERMETQAKDTRFYRLAQRMQALMGAIRSEDIGLAASGSADLVALDLGALVSREAVDTEDPGIQDALAAINAEGIWAAVTPCLAEAGWSNSDMVTFVSQAWEPAYARRLVTAAEIRQWQNAAKEAADTSRRDDQEWEGRMIAEHERA